MNALHALCVRLTVLIAFITLLPSALKAQNNVLLFNGNAFYWSDAKIDSVKETDAETGEMVWKISMHEAAFTKMNKDTIFNNFDKGTVEPVFKYNNQDETKYLQMLFKSKSEFKGMPPFYIDKMVIDKSGKPIYFEIQFDDVAQSRALKLKWGPGIEKYIKNMPYWRPGTRYGNPVLYYLGDYIHIAP